MQKRGQVSVFAIVGIVVLIIVALLFFLRNEYGFFVSPTSFLSDKAKPIEDNLRTCVDQTLKNNLEEFGKQGGDFYPNQYLFYQSKTVNYYCKNLPNTETCLNVMPSFDEIKNNLKNKIDLDLNECVDSTLVKSGFGYNIQAGKLSTELITSSSNLGVKVHYDVKIFKDGNEYGIKDVVVNYDAPIEEIYAVAVDIVNSEARVGFFEQLLYMLNKKGQYVINLDKPYPDKIYKINKKDSKFEFWFAVEGERNL